MIHPAEPMPKHPADDFLRGVEHGERVNAYREVGLRLELEGQARKRIRDAVAVERRAARARAWRLVLATAAFVAIAVYNLTLYGVRAPW